ncbi:hypothetical protein SAMN05428987_4987 [Paenibacillus sp. CF095]|nr:hypothetical protein SAMN05428987_4987 [Paenibacillus sp. CF095]
MWKKYRKYVFRYFKHNLIRVFPLSHSVWSAWIEINPKLQPTIVDACRTLYGVRGLKFATLLMIRSSLRRTPYGVRGLKYIIRPIVRKEQGRTPYGVRGLKYCSKLIQHRGVCRTPYGVRGLKSPEYQE